MSAHFSIKIILSHHDQRIPAIHTDILQSVQTGCANTAHIYPDMLHDDEGENISAENPKYNELSAHYWVWKNQDKIDNPDFIGLMHDRRHFLFNTKLPVPNKNLTWLPKSPVYMFPPICKKYLNYISDECIRQYFPKYDCMVLKQYDIFLRIGKGNMRDRFTHSEGMTYEIFDIWFNTVKKLFPSYLCELKQFAQGHMEYMCNMFVMRKDLFDEYSNFLFTILQTVDRQIDSTTFSTAKKRFLGYLGEFTLSVFIMKLKQRTDVHIIEMDGTFIMNLPWKERLKIVRYWVGKTFLMSKRQKKYQLKYNELLAKIKLLNFFKD